MSLDANGQPANPKFNEARLNDRMVDEMIGLCRGVMADGIVTEDEARSIMKWLESNREIKDQWPANAGQSHEINQDEVRILIK